VVDVDVPALGHAECASVPVDHDPGPVASAYGVVEDLDILVEGVIGAVRISDLDDGVRPSGGLGGGGLTLQEFKVIDTKPLCIHDPEDRRGAAPGPPDDASAAAHIVRLPGQADRLLDQEVTGQ